MKKPLFLALLALFTTQLIAQPVSKKGEIMLPEKGDYALGIDAVPFFEYFGKMFNEENQPPYVDYPNFNMAISGRYFKEANLAYRASVRLNVQSDRWTDYSPLFSVEGTNETVEDAYNRTVSNLYLSFGFEKRKGDTRIQGYYGAEGIIGFGTEDHQFDYGNQISQEDNDPDRTDFDIRFQDDNAPEVSTITEDGAFITQYQLGTNFMIGGRAFVGAEVFIFPKMSLGVEFGLAASLDYTGNGEIVTERWGLPPDGEGGERLVVDVEDTGISRSLGIDTDNTDGRLFLWFYF